jgi:hypothetical protein
MIEWRRRLGRPHRRPLRAGSGPIELEGSIVVVSSCYYCYCSYYCYEIMIVVGVDAWIDGCNNSKLDLQHQQRHQGRSMSMTTSTCASRGSKDTKRACRTGIMMRWVLEVVFATVNIRFLIMQCMYVYFYLYLVYGIQ